MNRLPCYSLPLGCLGALLLTLAAATADGETASVSSSPKDRTSYARALLPEDFTTTGNAPSPTIFFCDVVVSNTDLSLNNTDTFGDEEPSIAINPANPNEIVITAFSGFWGGTAPWWHSTNGGLKWTKRFTIPAPTGLALSGPEDQSIDFGQSNRLSGVFLASDFRFNTDVYAGMSTNPASLLAFAWPLSGGRALHANTAVSNNTDQPWLVVNRDPATASQDNVYVVYDDFDGSPDMRVAVAYGGNPPLFTTDNLVGHSTGFINPGHRPAKDPLNGFVYSLWQRRIAPGAGGSQNINFMLNRSTNGGATWGLNGSATGIIVGNGDSTQPTPKFGTVNALLGGVLHAAVDPNNGDVYYVYGKRNAATGNNRLVIRRLTNNASGGLNIGPEVFVTGQVQAALPAVAVTTNGTIGVLYDTFDGFSSSNFPIFSAHLAISTDAGLTFSDTVIYTFLSSARDNGDTRQRVLGDYHQMKAVGATFYGVFTANGAGLGRPIANHDPIFFKATVVAVATAPLITSQPADQTVFQDDTVAFSVGADGTAPLYYQWQFQGAPLIGRTQASLTLSNVTPAQAGAYSVVVSNAINSISSSNAILTVTPTVPLPIALNATGLVWTTGGNAIWHGLTNVSHDGVAAGQIGTIADGQVSRLQTSLTGPATVAFWWKISSQTNADFLKFSVNGAPQAAVSGEMDWQQRLFYLPAGVQALEWDYSKDASGSAGQDRAWLDEVGVTNGGTAPFIMTQPLNQASLGGSPVTFTVAANGTPSLSYQWRFEGGDIPGATSTSLTIPSPGASDSGDYSVRVTNSYGSIISAAALLGVVPLAVAGDDSLGQTDVPANATNVIAIAAGTWHNLALRADGHVLAWGNNGDGQCDVPTTLRNVVGFAAGGYHNLALKADGTVTAWGANYNGQASPPTGLSNVIAVTAGTWHSLALKSDGTVIGWGDNTSGQSAAPADLTDATAITAGGSHSLALRADGTVVAWGENTDEQGFYAGQSVVPSDLADVVAIGAGDYHSLAVKHDGTVVVWGDGSLGQTPLPASVTGVVAVSGGGGHSLALRSDRKVAAWGNNGNGQCNLSAGLTNVSAIAAGGSHSLLLLGVPVNGPQARYPLHQGDQFSVVTPTSFGKNYALEYKDSLSATGWTVLLPRTRGNGGLQFLIDGGATVPGRFYRVRQW